jgi:hypothetical protein
MQIGKIATAELKVFTLDDLDGEGYLNVWYEGRTMSYLTFKRPTENAVISLVVKNKELQNLENKDIAVAESPLLFQAQPLILKNIGLQLRNQYWTLRIANLLEGEEVQMEYFE